MPITLNKVDYAVTTMSGLDISGPVIKTTPHTVTIKAERVTGHKSRLNYTSHYNRLPLVITALRSTCDLYREG